MGISEQVSTLSDVRRSGVISRLLLPEALIPQTPCRFELLLPFWSGKVEFGTAMGVPDEAPLFRAFRSADFGEAFSGLWSSGRRFRGRFFCCE